MPNEFVARNGVIALNNSVVSGSLTVTQGITGSLFGTASWASQALTSSYILNAVSSSFAATASNVLGGAANYIPLFNTATSLSSSVIYQSDGNVGIGNAAPAYKLDLTGQLRISNYLYTSNNKILLGQDGTGGINMYLGDLGNDITGSKLFVYAQDYIDLRNNGASTMRLFSNGNIGVGTTTDAGYKLNVVGSLRTSADAAFATSSGSVGIGTESPASKLNVITTKTATLSTAADFLTLGATIDDNNAYNTANIGGGIAFRGRRNIEGTLTIYGAIDAAKENTANNEYRGMLRFYTNNNSTGIPAEHMRITSAGEILINTTTDAGAYALQVAGSIYNTTGAVLAASSGNVGIGTTTPNARLEVSGSAIVSGSLTVTDTITAQRLVVQTVTSSISFITGSTRFGSLLTNTHQFTGSVNMTGSLNVIGGNVGIGTTSPLSQLEVSSTSTRIRVVGTSGGAVNQYVTDGGQMFVGIDNSSASLFGNGAYSRVIYGGAAYPLDFYTNDVIRARIDASGNVGIGTTSPTVKLDVSSSAQHAMRITGGDGNGLFTTYYNGTISTLFFGHGSTLATGATLNDGVIRYNGSNNLIIARDGTEVARFNSSGNVGIGTITPNARLEVSGSAIVSGSLSVTQGITGSLFGTASWASNSISSSFATSASQAQNTVTASYAINALSSSYALSASWAPVAGTTVFPYTGSALFTGSILLTGSIVATETITAKRLTVVSGAVNIAPYTSSSMLIVSDASEWSNSTNYTYPQISIPGYRTGITIVNNDEVHIVSNGTAQLAVKDSGASARVTLPSHGWLRWSTGETNGFNHDIILKRESAAILAITGSVRVSGSVTSYVPFNTVTASYTLALSDVSRIVEMNNASANTITVPSSSVTNFPIGSQITVAAYGAGQVTFTSASTGVVIRSAGARYKLTQQYSVATLTKRGADEWYLFGDLTL